MTNQNNSKYSINLKSLLVIIGLQLVALQVHAVSMPFHLSEEPCHHSISATEANNHHNAADSFEICLHCEGVTLGCDNGSNAISLLFLTYNPEIDLETVHPPYSAERNPSLVAIYRPPKLRPPR